eukprot:SAG22_NODE_1794_length_3558_cov_2.608557_2_plen_47_part_00
MYMYMYGFAVGEIQCHCHVFPDCRIKHERILDLYLVHSCRLWPKIG